MTPPRPWLLVLHPSPVLGGSMRTSVIHHVYHAFARQGFGVMRFNFRGVGRSEGEKGVGEAEVADAATMLDWLQVQSPESREVWVAGFSFGAWVAMQLLMRRPEVGHFVAIAPPTDRMDFSFLQPCPGSGLVIQGEKDRISSPSMVETWARDLNREAEIEVVYRSIPGADHFFSKHMEKLVRAVDDYMDHLRKPAKKTRSRSRKKPVAKA